jgi:methyl-accepting chemotaxis protein
MQSINESASVIAASVQQQGMATQEIARNVNEAATGTASVSDTILTVSDVSRETNAASGRVLTYSETLAAEAEKLRVEVDGFLRVIRGETGEESRMAA